MNNTKIPSINFFSSNIHEWIFHNLALTFCFQRLLKYVGNAAIMELFLGSHMSILHKNITMVLPPRTHAMWLFYMWNDESFLLLPVICSAFISNQALY